jgi:hypothetical protein
VFVWVTFSTISLWSPAVYIEENQLMII